MDTSKTTSPAPRSRWRRIAPIAFVIIVVIAGVIALALNYYLNSSQARALAANKLTAIVGLPIEVESLSIGSSQTEITLKSVARDQNEPLFSIASVTADISLWDIVSGRADPKSIVLKGVKVVVPLDRDGKLLAPLPQATSPSKETVLPSVRVEDASFRVRQEGRPEFVLEKIQLTASTQKDRYVVDGGCDDPHWGRWNLSGNYQLNGDAGQIALTSVGEAPLVFELLRSIPAVPPETWEHVGATGRSTADIRFNFGKEFTYSVDLKPTGHADLTLPDLDVPLQNLIGTIRVAGAKVFIEQCRARLAEGTVKVDGTLDFEAAESKLTFKVDAEGLALNKLPAAWSLPSQITGKLRGQANLELTVNAKGELEPRGGGEATIVDARIGNLPAEVKLRLRGDGRRYRFESNMTMLDGEPETVPVNVILQEPKPEPKPLPEATTLDAMVTLRDVEISELLKQFEVQTPYKLSGKVTVQVTAAVPVGGVADRGSYRFRGTITSPSFKVDGLEIRNVNAEIRYRDGVLRVSELKADFPQTNGPPGRLAGSAKVEVEPRGDATANLTLIEIPVASVLAALPGAKIDLTGNLSGQAEVKIPFQDIKTLTTWTGRATLTAKTLVVKGGTIDNLSVKAVLDRGVVKLTEAKADLFQGTITGSGEVPLSGAQAGKIVVDFKDVDSGPATRLVPGFPVPLTGRISGKLTASAEPVKDAKPRLIAADLNLSAPKLTVRGIPAERLTGRITVAENVAEYSLEGHSLGGTFEVKGRYPAKPGDGDRGQLRLRNLNLARLAAALRNPALEPLRGAVNLDFEFLPDGSVGTGRLALTQLQWGRDRLSDELVGNISLTDGVIDVRDFGGVLAGGRLRVRARYDLDDSRRNFYSLTLDRASSQRLAAVAALEVPEAETTITARGRIGDQAGSTITVSLNSARVGSVPLTGVAIPIQWTGDFKTGRISISDGMARFGSGSITANVNYVYGSSSRLSGDVRFNRVQLKALIGTSTFGNGRLSGRLNLGGDAIRSIDDVTATLNATLNQTSVREVPLISVVTPFLQPIGFLQPFETGEIKGRFSKGIFRLERFALSNPGANVFAEGSVTRKGRVDLDVIAVTGQVGPNVRVLRVLGLGALGPLPLTTIQRVSDLLSNRLLRLTVTGTIAAPNVQLNKAALLTDTAVRFFLGQYIVPQSLAR